MIIVLESPIGTVVPNDGREPISGDWVQVTKGKRVTKRQYSEPVTVEPDPIISITNVVFSGNGYEETQEDGRIDLSTDSNITLSFNVTLPDTTKLTIPVINKSTGQMKVIRARVTSNAVSKTIKFKESGFWYINSQIINDMGRKGVEFQIDDILMLVLDD